MHWHRFVLWCVLPALGVGLRYRLLLQPVQMPHISTGSCNKGYFWVESLACFLVVKPSICVVRWLIEGFCAPSGASLPCSTEIGSRAAVTLSPGRLRERPLQHAVVAMADCPRQVPTFIFDLGFIKSAVRMPPPPPVAPWPWCMFSPWRPGICLAMFVFCFANCRRDR